MKMLAVIGILFGFGNLAWTSSDPYDPICRQANASSETVQLENSSTAVTLCRFSFNTFVDKISVQRASINSPTMVVSNYQSNQEFPFNQSCVEFGARVVRAHGKSGHIYRLCEFFDSSYMEEQTFARGPHDFSNREMNQALHLYSNSYQN